MSAHLEEFVVTTDGGHLFACHVEDVGGVNAPRHQRWIFEDATTRYVGPPFFGPLQPTAVQQLVSEWWGTKQAVGQVDAEIAKPGAVSLRVLDESDASMIDELNRRADVGRYIGKCVAVPSRSGRFYAIIQGGASAGIVGLTTSGAYDGSDVELVCAVSEPFAGRGVALAACRALLDAELSLTPARRILACVDPDNAKGLSLARRLKFIDTGDVRWTGEHIWQRRAEDVGRE